MKMININELSVFQLRQLLIIGEQSMQRISYKKYIREYYRKHGTLHPDCLPLVDAITRVKAFIKKKEEN